MRALVCACVRACVHACVRVCTNRVLAVGSKDVSVNGWVEWFGSYIGLPHVSPDCVGCGCFVVTF